MKSGATYALALMTGAILSLPAQAGAQESASGELTIADRSAGTLEAGRGPSGLEAHLGIPHEAPLGWDLRWRPSLRWVRGNIARSGSVSELKAKPSAGLTARSSMLSIPYPGVSDR